MKYLNRFHQESAERKLAKIAKIRPIPAKEASKQVFEMHNQMAKTYPKQRNK